MHFRLKPRKVKEVILLKKRSIYDFTYYNFTGSWAWIFNRLSGLALIFYLCMHIWVINTLTKGPETFDSVMRFLNSAPFKLMETALWAAILFHAFNGVRIVIIDFFKGAYVQKKLFAVLITLAFLLWLAGSYLIIRHLGGAA
jgi:succinate dehydrogenase / fumarate reductase, cytochrome b subunit